MDDALRCGLVELAARIGGQRLGLLGVAGLDGLVEAAHGRLQRRAHSLVALASRLVLTVALDL